MIGILIMFCPNLKHHNFFVTYLLFRSVMFGVWHFRGCSTIIPGLCIRCCLFTRGLHSVPLPVWFTDNLVLAHYLKTLIACVYGLIVKMSGNLDQITYPEKLDKHYIIRHGLHLRNLWLRYLPVRCTWPRGGSGNSGHSLSGLMQDKPQAPSQRHSFLSFLQSSSDLHCRWHVFLPFPCVLLTVSLPSFSIVANSDLSGHASGFVKPRAG